MTPCKHDDFDEALREPMEFPLSFFNDRFNKEFLLWIKRITPAPSGQVPVFEREGKFVCQSPAICRYLAKKCDLAGKDDWETLEIDLTVDTIYDVRAKIAAHYYETNEAAKAEKQKAAEELVPIYIQRLDEQVKQNGGFLVGGKPTLADIVFVNLQDYLNTMAGHDIIAKASNLKTLKDKVLVLPKFKTWVVK